MLSISFSACIFSCKDSLLNNRRIFLFVFHSLSSKLHQLTRKLLPKFILIIFFLVIFVGFSLLEVFSKRFLYLENKTMKMKNRNKVDTLPASCNYYTMLIDYRNQY